MCNNFPFAKIFYVLFVIQGQKRDPSSHSSLLFSRYKFTSNLTPSHKNIPFSGVFTKISSCRVCVVNRRGTEHLGSSFNSSYLFLPIKLAGEKFHARPLNTALHLILIEETSFPIAPLRLKLLCNTRFVISIIDYVILSHVSAAIPQA